MSDINKTTTPFKKIVSFAKNLKDRPVVLHDKVFRTFSLADYIVSFLYILIPMILFLTFYRHSFHLVDLHSWLGFVRVASETYWQTNIDGFSWVPCDLFSIIIGYVFRMIGGISFYPIIFYNFLLFIIALFLTDRMVCSVYKCGLSSRLFVLLAWMSPAAIMLFRRTDTLTLPLFMLFFVFCSIFFTHKRQTVPRYFLTFLICFFAMISHRSMICYQAYLLFVVSLILMADFGKNFKTMFSAWGGYLSGLVCYLIYICFFGVDVLFSRVVDSIFVNYFFIITSGLIGGVNLACLAVLLLAVFFSKHKVIGSLKDLFLVTSACMVILIPGLSLYGLIRDMHIKWQYFYPIFSFVAIGSVGGYLALNVHLRRILLFIKILIVSALLFNNVTLYPVHNIFKGMWVRDDVLGSQYLKYMQHIFFNELTVPPEFDCAFYLRDQRGAEVAKQRLFHELDLFFELNPKVFFMEYERWDPCKILQTYAISRDKKMKYLWGWGLTDEKEITDRIEKCFSSGIPVLSLDMVKVNEFSNLKNDQDRIISDPLTYYVAVEVGAEWYHCFVVQHHDLESIPFGHVFLTQIGE